MFRPRFRLTLVFLVLAATLVPLDVCLAFPPLPSSFFGKVRINGSDVPPGTVVQASINGRVYAEGYTQIYQNASVYALDVPGDDAASPAVEGGREGDAIAFVVGGLPALPAGAWRSGTNVGLDLDASGAASLPTVTPSATPGPTATPRPPVPTSAPPRVATFPPSATPAATQAPGAAPLPADTAFPSATGTPPPTLPASRPDAAQLAATDEAPGERAAPSGPTASPAGAVPPAIEPTRATPATPTQTIVATSARAASAEPARATPTPILQASIPSGPSASRAGAADQRPGVWGGPLLPILGALLLAGVCIGGGLAWLWCRKT